LDEDDVVLHGLDLSARGRARVYLLTALGTLLCIAVAFLIDSYSWQTGAWRWGGNPINNLIIPLILAPPFFFILLSKLRELAIAHEELMMVASTDALTSCLNRRAFTAMVDGYLERIQDQKSKTEGALLVIDVDYFKAINDNFGHDCGDVALKLIADTIKGAVREIDLVGRIGGEEFSVFLPDLDPSLTPLVAERIRAAVDGVDFAPGGRRHELSVSVGGAIFYGNAAFSMLYKLADERLYEAKRNGRNRVEMVHVPAPEAAQRIAVH
jgi:diguanylate cyclase (GGDEF)-like protein